MKLGVLNLSQLAALTQIPNLSAQYNFDTFLIQFQTKIKERESGDRETLKSCVIALVLAFIFYTVVNIVAQNLVLYHS